MNVDPFFFFFLILNFPDAFLTRSLLPLLRPFVGGNDRGGREMRIPKKKFKKISNNNINNRG